MADFPFRICKVFVADVPHHGHSQRISGTFVHLLCGVPFEAVKVKGRWQGQSFQK